MYNMILAQTLSNHEVSDLLLYNKQIHFTKIYWILTNFIIDVNSWRKEHKLKKFNYQTRYL